MTILRKLPFAAFLIYVATSGLVFSQQIDLTKTNSSCVAITFSNVEAPQSGLFADFSVFDSDTDLAETIAVNDDSYGSQYLATQGSSWGQILNEQSLNESYALGAGYTLFPFAEGSVGSSAVTNATFSLATPAPPGTEVWVKMSWNISHLSSASGGNSWAIADFNSSVGVSGELDASGVFTVTTPTGTVNSIAGSTWARLTTSTINVETFSSSVTGNNDSSAFEGTALVSLNFSISRVVATPIGAGPPGTP